MYKQSKQSKNSYLRQRAKLLSSIRQYFNFHNVLEVQTPVLNEYPTSEPSIENFVIENAEKCRYLRTSPESSLKKLVASRIGDIFEVGPVFRKGEESPIHLNEFTMLEWYRLGYDHKKLIRDVELLVDYCGGRFEFRQITFMELFVEHVGLNPHSTSNAELSRAIVRFGLKLNDTEKEDRDYLLTCLYVLGVEPNIKAYGAFFLTDFPKELRAYARLSDDKYCSAQRFELIINGVEVANGYHEVIDPIEQQHCFEIDNETRLRRGLTATKIDKGWIAALKKGMPACAGVAVGLERLQMVLDEKINI